MGESHRLYRCLTWLLLGLFTCAAAACSKPAPSVELPSLERPTASSFISYQNDTWGYMVSYPKDWLIDTTHPDRVSIKIPPPHLGGVSIIVTKDSILPIEHAARTYIEVASEHWDDFRLLSNKTINDVWDWYVSYTYTWRGIPFQEEVYFKQTKEYVYTLSLTAERELYLGYPFDKIVSSFSLESEPTHTTASGMLLYEHPDYSYTIQYPANWELLDSQPDKVLIYKILQTEFAIITIHTSRVRMPIEEYAEFFRWYLRRTTADEWRGLNFTCDQKLSDKWDWLLCFKYTDITGDVPLEAQGEAYIVQTSAYTFIVQWDSTKEHTETCRKIVNSFMAK